MTANHSAGQDENGNPKKQYWPPPEGTAPARPENANPLLKLLMDASTSQEALLEDHLLLTNASIYIDVLTIVSDYPATNIHHPKNNVEWNSDLLPNQVGHSDQQQHWLKTGMDPCA